MQIPLGLKTSYLLMALALVGADLANSQAFSANSGSMAQPLICPTATQLQDGTILIVGGDNTTTPTSAAQIYNPSAQTFTPTGSTNVAHGCGSTATLLNDGTVLITGGQANSGGTGSTTAELFIPSSGTFSLRTPPTLTNQNGSSIGPMNAARIHATATLLQSGSVLIAGGDAGDWAGLTSSEIYNPATGQFTAVSAQMHTRRTTHTATLLSDGTVLIAGGQGNYSGQQAWDTAELYNPSNQTFTSVGNLTTTRDLHTANLLTNGTVLIAGGENSSGTTLSSAEIYTPSSKSFAAAGSMTSGRVDFTATLLADGTVLMAGGYNGSGNALNSAEIYSSATQTFTPTGNMTVPRAYQTATMLFNGEILMIGGESAVSSLLPSAELYSYPVTTVTMSPAYKVASLIYAAPGNKSQDGYTDSTTNSTTTTIGSSFAEGQTINTSFGFNFPGIGGVTASQSFATSSTSSSIAAFQESFTNATAVANQSNGSAPDAVNHNNDLFLLWLNPQITAFGSESGEGPIGYALGTQPLANGAASLPDIVEVYANAMEANSAGSTSVPASILNQIQTISGQYVPGLASICRNLIQPEYAAGTCTLQDQCGCTPADFLPILQNDPLLFYYGLTKPVSSYPATASPLSANVASEMLCGTLPLTPGSNCRYVPVPTGFGITEQEGVTLEGPNTPGGDNPLNMFQQGENSQTIYTLGGQQQTTVNDSYSVSINISTGCIDWSFLGLGSCSKSGGSKGSGTGQFGVTNSMTWTDSQSVGTTSGSGVNLSVTLGSSTVGCAQENNIAVFEDTIYHSFVFQQPPSDPSTCTQLSPSFSIAITPNNPSQTALSLGHSMSYTVNVAASNGFNGPVALSISGLPAGVTANFSPTSITTSSVASSTLTLTAAYSNSTYIGNSTLTVTGTSGSASNSALIQLTTQPLQYAGYCGVH